MVKNRGMGNLFGLKGEYIEGNGKMVSRMEEEFLFQKKGSKRQEFGVWVKRLDGFNDISLILTVLKILYEVDLDQSANGFIVALKFQYFFNFISSYLCSEFLATSSPSLFLSKSSSKGVLEGST